MEFKVGYRTDVGRKRSQNQDCGATLPELGLFVVADGMGGHKGGETASILSVEKITSYFREHIHDTSLDPQTLITRSFISANRAIYDLSQAEPGLHGMGTTTVALFFKDRKLTIGHAGDSRCYFFRPNAIWQATRDHSLVQEKLRMGLITRDQVKTDQMKNVITRSVGFESKLDVDVYRMDVEPRDCFLLCSDGLSGLVEDHQILEIVMRNIEELQKGVDELIDTANANGGDDNITALLVQVN